MISKSFQRKKFICDDCGVTSEQQKDGWKPGHALKNLYLKNGLETEEDVMLNVGKAIERWPCVISSAVDKK